jgi:hypothetical protein
MMVGFAEQVPRARAVMDSAAARDPLAMAAFWEQAKVGLSFCVWEDWCVHKGPIDLERERACLKEQARKESVRGVVGLRAKWALTQTDTQRDMQIHIDKQTNTDAR